METKQIFNSKDIIKQLKIIADIEFAKEKQKLSEIYESIHAKINQVFKLTGEFNNILIVPTEFGETRFTINTLTYIIDKTGSKIYDILIRDHKNNGQTGKFNNPTIKDLPKANVGITKFMQISNGEIIDHKYMGTSEEKGDINIKGEQVNDKVLMLQYITRFNQESVKELNKVTSGKYTLKELNLLKPEEITNKLKDAIIFLNTEKQA